MENNARVSKFALDVRDRKHCIAGNRLYISDV